MGIAITEDHRDLAGVARSFLEARGARNAARELLDSDTESRPAFWDELAGLGWLGLHIPEECGGAGGGLPELVVVVEEFGRAVAPGPFVPTTIASAIIAAAGTDAQRTRWLPTLVDGTRTGAVGVQTSLEATGDRLHGDAGVVFGAGLAEVLVLTVGDDVVVVDAAADGVTVDTPPNLDPTRRCGRVTLTDVAVAEGDVLPGAAPIAVALARTIAAAEAVGGANDCVAAAVEYAKVREQFGRTIGTFQAVKHHLANMLVAIAGWSGLEPDALRERMIDTGYLMPHWPKPWGRAADAVEQLVIEQEMADAGVSRPELGITSWVVLTLIQHGTAEQIERFVLPALRGDQVWCQLFSEPGAGSDAAAVSSKAIRTDGGWTVTGQKVWTSGAAHCRFGLATVRTDPHASKHGGITTVIVDMSAPGVEVRPLRQITGGSEFNEVFLTDVFVPDADVVGEPNDGWKVARATLGNERVSIGGGGVAASQGAVAAIVELTRRYGDRIAAAAERAGQFVADEHALRLLNLRRAARNVAGAEPGPEGNVTKLLIAEHVVDRARLTAELFGPDVGLFAPPAKSAGLLVLGSRGMTIAGGTSEITRNQIAERILGLPRDPLIS